MSTKGHRDGGKFKGHTTVIEAARLVVDTLEKLEVVTGISISFIEKTKSCSGRVVSYKPSISGLEVKVRGNRYVQTFYIYCNRNDVHKVENTINTKFPKPKKKKGKRKKSGRKIRKAKNSLTVDDFNKR